MLMRDQVRSGPPLTFALGLCHTAILGGRFIEVKVEGVSGKEITL